jgi:hypothetical protein
MFGSEGAQALAEILKINTGLAILSLAGSALLQSLTLFSLDLTVQATSLEMEVCKLWQRS